MAAIARRTLLALAAGAMLKAADNSGDALRVVNRLTTALSAGDAGLAMDAFDKSCPGYDTLSDYFAALTNAFAITNEADVTDEQDSATSISLTLDWTLTLRSLASETTVRRQKEVKLQIAPKNWKITRFSPIDLFNPA